MGSGAGMAVDIPKSRDIVIRDCIVHTLPLKFYNYFFLTYVNLVL